MKLTCAEIQNFKGLKSLTVDFEKNGVIQPLTAFLGDNGSGKTTALQAIALTLSLATRRTPRIENFNWHGFLPERISSLGETHVRLKVTLDQSEVQATSQLFELWKQSLTPEQIREWDIVAPSQLTEITLELENGRLISPQGWAAVNQFLGRYYIRWLSRRTSGLRDRYSELGDIFWFDQHRNLGAMLYDEREGSPDTLQREGWQAGVEQLREFLVGWWGHHTTQQRRGRDFIPPLEERFARVFPGTRFVGIMPRGDFTSPRANDFYFLLDRDSRIYDLAEMSSGEQAVFPLAYEFVRLNISRSIVLIDELELHLHPPEQQRLLASLPKIGPDCQFLITTHSEFLTSAIPNEYEVRLERGMRCL
jgi:predicted ATPase